MTDPVPQRFAVKIKHLEGNRYWFMTPEGRSNHLRIHAATFTDREAAQEFIDKNSAGSPDFTFRIQPL